MSKASAAPALTTERLRELLNYDPESGNFTRKVHASGTARAGDRAGSRHCAGYLTIRIDGRAYLSHRLAWLYMKDRWPSAQIDHIDGRRDNNAFANLRECTNAQNCQNVRAHKDGSGKLGTTFDKQKQRWVAQLGVNGRHVFLGYFDDQDAAHAAYMAAKRLHHDFSTGGVNA